MNALDEDEDLINLTAKDLAGLNGQLAMHASLSVSRQSRDDHITSSRTKLATKLRRRRLVRLEKLFRKVDEDDSGSIDVDEFRQLLPEALIESLGDEGVHDLFVRLDTDNSGGIELSEMPNLMSEVQQLQVRFCRIIYLIPVSYYD